MHRDRRVYGRAARPADLNWVFTFMHALRAKVAGDPERDRRLATEAFQIGTEGGEPDAAASSAHRWS